MVSASKLPSQNVLPAMNMAQSFSCRWSAGVLTATEMTEPLCAIASRAQRRALAISPNLSRYTRSGDARSELAVAEATCFEPTINTWAKERVHITESGAPHGDLVYVES